MAHPENPNPQVLVENTFRSAVGRMARSPHRNIRETAEFMRDLERLKLLHLEPDTNQFRSNSISDFGFVHSEGTNLFQPTIIVKHNFLLTQPSESVDADLIRTFTVARQYFQHEPRQLFQDRLVDVYGRALGLQEEWLKEHPASLPISIDPRITSREEVVKALIGSKRFYCDVGVADWEAALDGATKWSETTGTQIYPAHFIRELQANPREFVLVRDGLLNDAAASLYQQYGENFSDFTADQRAELTTNEYLKIIYAAYSSTNSGVAAAN